MTAMIDIFKNSYLENIMLREPNIGETPEPIVGGMPLFYNNDNKLGITLGGQSKTESSSKISHLAVPLGLVLTKHVPCPMKSTKEPMLLEDRIFDKLYDSITYQKKSKTYTRKFANKQLNKRKTKRIQ